jgi:hypothetical protein
MPIAPTSAFRLYDLFKATTKIVALSLGDLLDR